MIGSRIKIARIFIPGPAGRLEALLEWDPNTPPQLAAVVCHPHPLYGGTFHNKVVYRAAKAALQEGVPALRFNFRGVGKSQGEFGEGKGEQEDVRAALDELETRFPQTPLCVMGFSFGAAVGLAAGASDARVAALIGLGLPTTSTDLGFLHLVQKPKLIVQASEDVFGPREQVEALFASIPGPKRLHWVEGTNHFFAGKLDEVQAATRAFLREIRL